MSFLGTMFFFSFLAEMERLDLDKWPMYYVL